MGESVDHLQIAVAIVDHEEAKESVQAEINVKWRHETEVKEWVFFPSKEIWSVSLASVLTENLLWNAIEIVTARF